MEYDDKNKFVNNDEISKANQKTFNTANSSYFHYILAGILTILFIILIIVYNITLNSVMDYSSERKKESYSINETQITELNILKPEGFKEILTHFKLPNEVEIILMNPKNKKIQRDSVGLIVGSGAMNDDKIEGLAHFTEHMLFLGSQKYSNETFFNDYITSNEGHFNGFTDKDTTTFIYEINKSKFLESLDVFLNFFVKPLFKSEYLEKEIFAVNSEFEKNIHSDEKRFDRLFQTMSNPNHPFSRFSTGNKKTLKGEGLTNHMLRDKVLKYFHKHYIGKNMKIVVYTNHELENVKNILLNNMIKVHNHNTLSVKEKFLQRMKIKNNSEDLEIFTHAEKGKIIFYKSRYKTMKVFFFLNDLKHDLENNPKMFFKILFSMKYKNSLVDNLMKQRLIFNYSVDFKDKYNNFSAIFFKFLLTENGLRNLEKIIKMLAEFLHLTHQNISNKKIFEQIKEMNNKNFLNKKAIGSPYDKMKRFTKNFYLFGKNNFIAGDNLIRTYDHELIHSFIKNLTLSNSQIYVGARSFKNFNKTYFYKILNDEDEKLKKYNDKYFQSYSNDNSNNEKTSININNVKNYPSVAYADNYTNNEDNQRNMNSQSEGKNQKIITSDGKSISSISNDQHMSNSQLDNYSENEFLSQKEKWYKTKYKIYKLDEDHIWHIFKREINGTNLVYPDITIPQEKKKYLKNTSLCYQNSHNKLNPKECQKLFVNDRKFLIPNFIHKSNYTEVYLKTDRIHLDKSFIINIKLIPKLDIFNLENPQKIVFMKLLIIYLNFLYSEIKLKNNNFYDYQTQVSFMDNYLKKIPLFSWRNSKEKLSPQDFIIDGLYLKIQSKSAEIFELSETFENLKKVLKTDINKSDFIFLKEELYRYIEFYKSSNPTHQAFSWLYRLGFKNDINYLNITHIIKQIKLVDFLNYKNDFFNITISDIKILILGVGTLNTTKTIDYANKIEEIFTDVHKLDVENRHILTNKNNSDIIKIEEQINENPTLHETYLHNKNNEKYTEHNKHSNQKDKIHHNGNQNAEKKSFHKNHKEKNILHNKEDIIEIKDRVKTAHNYLNIHYHGIASENPKIPNSNGNNQHKKSSPHNKNFEFNNKKLFASENSFNLPKFIISNIHQSFIKPPYSKYGNKYIYQSKNIYKHSPDSSTLNVYFLGENNIYNNANMRMITLIAGNIFFSNLRIKQQLGYSVKNKVININNNLLFTIYVQGSKKHPSIVHKNIEKVIEKIKNKINTLEESTFENIKNTVQDQILEIPYKLQSKNNVYWSHLLGYDFIFNKKQVHIYMKELKTYDLEKFIDKILEYRISVQVFNSWLTNPNEDKESIYIRDINHFRKTGEFIDTHMITDEISKPKATFKPEENFRIKSNK